MKSFILGLGTLLALASDPASATAQEQYPPQYGADPSAMVAPSPGPEYDQQGGYAADPNAAAMAEQQPAAAFGYFGPHPIANEQGGGFCQEAGAHQHEYPVFDRNLFRVVNGYAYFTGDPSDFGYQGQGYIYRGDHPLDAEYGGGFCYMHWAHHHWFAPVSVSLAWDGGGYAFTGVWPQSYYINRPLYVNYYNDYYRRYYLGGGYSWRRPAPIYAGWGWHRPMVGGGWNRPGGFYRQPFGRPGYVNPGYGYRAPGYGYRAPAYGYRAPAPMYRAPAPMYRAPAPMYRAPAPMYRAPAPAYHVAAPGYRAPAPSYRAPAPSYGGGGGHFGGGGGGHFGGGGGGGGGHFGGGGGGHFGGGGGGGHFGGGGGGHFGGGGGGGHRR